MGLIAGSFVNVVVYRLPRRRSIILPGSRCPRCKAPIRWWDNLPILSYLLLRGKCRSCHKPISIRYPVTEALTAILFVATEMKFGLSATLFLRHWPLIIFLMSITFIDLQRRIIPDELSLGGLALGLLTCWMLDDPGWISCLIGAALGFGLFFGLAWIYQKSRQRTGLGGGDIKLLAMIGAFVGPAGVFSTVFISSLLGCMVGVSWAYLSKEKSILQVSIPFGPFLVVGALYYYLLGDILWFQFMNPM
jgi:leader peptidase (prepilin peptidase)/N-methyltransferase